ncbi:unnamed protein product [Protopolystoma xenopodis]|uniref:Uncharacterized protein n=1 Tax=Protopolystoma xenopodis TaxID=117903 RepID=A0A448XLE8_9PLAT|nr:unnamed protein product [Protopolystoma xenopodis]
MCITSISVIVTVWNLNLHHCLPTARRLPVRLRSRIFGFIFRWVGFAFTLTPFPLLNSQHPSAPVPSSPDGLTSAVPGRHGNKGSVCRRAKASRIRRLTDAPRRHTNIAIRRVGDCLISTSCHVACCRGQMDPSPRDASASSRWKEANGRLGQAAQFGSINSRRGGRLPIETGLEDAQQIRGLGASVPSPVASDVFVSSAQPRCPSRRSHLRDAEHTPASNNSSQLFQLLAEGSRQLRCLQVEDPESPLTGLRKSVSSFVWLSLSLVVAGRLHDSESC